MNKLYSLMFYTYPNGDYREEFGIGIFSTWQKAKEAEERYRKEVLGFKDYPCESEIMEIQVIGRYSEDIREVYRFEGWNTDENLDEIDILYSGCYVSKAQAEIDMKETRLHTPRQEWVLNRYIINQCEWKYGFVREF